MVLFQLLTSFVEIAHPGPSTDVSAPAPRVQIALRGVGSLWKVFMNPVMKLQLEVSVCSGVYFVEGPISIPRVDHVLLCGVVVLYLSI
jgi:hypothetical protein